MDDESGWSLILTEGWGPLVLDAVVRWIESATIGDRARMVGAAMRPDESPADDVEWLHELILQAIAAETGADLEVLGSQAAWACYEQTWNTLADRWSGGGRLVTVSPEHHATVAAAIARLPVRVAIAAGADASAIPAQPIVIDGVLHIDAEGLFALLATGPELPSAVRSDVDLLLSLARRSNPGRQLPDA